MRAICLFLPLLLTSAGSNPTDDKCLVDVGESHFFVRYRFKDTLQPPIA